MPVLARCQIVPLLALQLGRHTGHSTRTPTLSFIYGLQPRAIHGMLDFDYSCCRSARPVAAMIYLFCGHHIQKFYWGTKGTREGGGRQAL